MILEKIEKVNDIKCIADKDLPVLAQEIRDFLIESLSKTGGHLASNLGVVELTLALHRVFSLPEDKIIWDVGHQSYTHKILTGRKAGFENLRMYGGMSGFPKRMESDCDSFDTGHSTTSISAGLGYVRARDINNEDYNVVAVIGDGSFTGGMAYEAINNAAALDTNFIIVLNDNEMSISENVGGISAYLSNIRTAQIYTNLKMSVTNMLNKVPGVGRKAVEGLRRTKRSIKQLVIPGMFFEDMGLTYLGPVDGHNIQQLTKIFLEAKRVKGPVLVHVLTEKGRGYAPAVHRPSKYHGVGAFEVLTGAPIAKKDKPNYQDVFSSTMEEIGSKHANVVAITAAMAEGTGLFAFGEKYPERFFDVGIAEEHAVTFSAGLCLGGMIPVFAIYSSFLQRALDQVMIDVCMQKLHVVFAIDRAGLVGNDGETHQGCFDLSYLSMIPNMTVMAPKNDWELAEMMNFAITHSGPIAVRYPRGTAYDGMHEFQAPIELGKSEIIQSGKDVALVAVGKMVEIAKKAADILKEKHQMEATLVNARFVKPFDKERIRELVQSHDIIVTLEDNIHQGGFGQQVADWLYEENLHPEMINVSIPDCFVEHGSVSQLYQKLGMDAESIVQKVLSVRKK